MSTHDPDDDLLRELGEHARERRTREALRPLSKDFEKRVVQQIERSVDEDGPSRAHTTLRPWMALAASVILGVGLSFALIDRGPSQVLPDYELEFREGAAVRSSGVVAALRSGDELEVILRPDVDVSESMSVMVLRTQSDVLHPVDVQLRLAASGAVRINASLDSSLNLTPGSQIWWFVVARKGHEPDASVFNTLADDVRDKHWQAFRHQFEWRP